MLTPIIFNVIYFQMLTPIIFNVDSLLERIYFQMLTIIFNKFSNVNSTDYHF